MLVIMAALDSLARGSRGHSGAVRCSSFLGERAMHKAVNLSCYCVTHAVVLHAVPAGTLEMVMVQGMFYGTGRNSGWCRAQ
jgi:hypothetical protein